MWPSVIKGVGLDLLYFPSELSAAVMGPLIPALTRIVTVASPPSMFVVIGVIAPNRLLGHRGV